MRIDLRPLAAALVLTGAFSATTARADDCVPKVEAAAEKVFASLVRAMRASSAEGVTELMAPAKDARLTLRLVGVKAGSYTTDQATEVLKSAYFKAREILTLTEDEGCTRGSEARLARAYRMRVRSAGKEQDGTLTAVLQRGDAGWYLSILSDS